MSTLLPRLLLFPSTQTATVGESIDHANSLLTDTSQDTTTFYKAEVSQPWRAKETSTIEKGEYVRLRFEGETDEMISQEVERRFVLVDK